MSDDKEKRERGVVKAALYRAYYAGKQACVDGVPRDENPYRSESLRVKWFEGYDARLEEFARGVGKKPTKRTSTTSSSTTRAR